MRQILYLKISAKAISWWLGHYYVRCTFVPAFVHRLSLHQRLESYFAQVCMMFDKRKYNAGEVTGETRYVLVAPRFGRWWRHAALVTRLLQSPDRSCEPPPVATTRRHLYESCSAGRPSCVPFHIGNQCTPRVTETKVDPCNFPEVRAPFLSYGTAKNGVKSDFPS